MSIVKVEAAGDGGTTLTSGARRYNGGGTSRSLKGVEFAAGHLVNLLRAN
jgi:hypothetical protein